jgi:hypothetical protein
VVTTLKDAATRQAICIAASAIPITGARATSRAARNPGSPKQAMTWASTPAASPALICASKPGSAMASSVALSIDAGPVADCTARICVPVAATWRAATAIFSVMAAVVWGLISWMLTFLMIVTILFQDKSNLPRKNTYTKPISGNLLVVFVYYCDNKEMQSDSQ